MLVAESLERRDYAWSKLRLQWQPTVLPLYLVYSLRRCQRLTSRLFGRLQAMLQSNLGQLTLDQRSARPLPKFWHLLRPTRPTCWSLAAETTSTLVVPVGGVHKK